MFRCEKFNSLSFDVMRRWCQLLVCMMLACVSACSVKSEHADAFEHVMQLKYERPDLALSVLDSMRMGNRHFSHHDEMVWRLHRMDVENKLDTVFHTTDAAQRLVDYFDNHGSPNEQVLANYLLGRAYADTHEAPMALHCYMDAMEKADTTRDDCDFKLLSRVYIQAGEVLDVKRLTTDRSQFIHQAINYAKKGEDSLAIVHLYSMLGEVYEGQDNIDSAIIMYEYVAQRFSQLGLPELAAGWLGYCARLHNEKGEYTKAAEHLQMYEKNSGFFCEDGEIEEGREPYYGIKGKYYLGVNKLDSAEYFYRLELIRGLDFNNQSIGSRGLSKVYSLKNMPDSAAKYAMYCLQMSDSLYERNVTEKLKKVKDFYDYSRSQRTAIVESEKARVRMVWLLIYGGVSSGVFAAIFFCFCKMRKKKMADAIMMRSLFSEVARLESEISRLRLNEQEHADLICEKEERLSYMESELEKYKSRWKNKIIVPDGAMIETELYKHIHDLSLKGHSLSEKDWHDIRKMIEELLPEFNKFMKTHYHLLSEKEYRICILVRMYIRPASIANMLCVSSAYISKSRTVMLKTLFDVVGKASEFDKRIQELC